MPLTNRQRLLLANLDRIAVRTKASGKVGFFLADEECSSTINSLIVKRLIMKTRDGKGLRMSEHLGTMSQGMVAT